MKDFSTLNGYRVKDKIARQSLNYVFPEDFGAIGDGITNDTAAIQSAINTGKDVYFPAGTYLVSGNGLTINTNHQKIMFNKDASIIANNINNSVLNITSTSNKLENVKINLENNTQTNNIIVVNGEKCVLDNIVTSGTGLNGLLVNAKDVCLHGGNFSGTKNGINISNTATGFYCENVKIEQCTADGFVAIAEKIELHKVHSFKNGNYGFNLIGINLSNIYDIFANENLGNGVNITNTTGLVNIYGGKSSFSGFQKTDKTANDWYFSGVTNLNLYGCYSMYGPDGKASSFSAVNNSAVNCYTCSADLAPINGEGSFLKFINCYDVLKPYNVNHLNSYKTEKTEILNDRNKDIKVYLNEMFKDASDVIAYECVIQYASSLNTNTVGSSKYYIYISENYDTLCSADKTDFKVRINNAVTIVGERDKHITLNVYNGTQDRLNVVITLTKISSMN